MITCHKCEKKMRRQIGWVWESLSELVGGEKLLAVCSRGPHMGSAMDMVSEVSYVSRIWYPKIRTCTALGSAGLCTALVHLLLNSKMIC